MKRKEGPSILNTEGCKIMATSGFDWSTVLKSLIDQRTQTVAATNAAAVSAYADQFTQWIAVNTISRDRVSNVNFTPSPLPAIPHKQGVDQTSGAIIDLGPFPDLKPPVLPDYQDAHSTPIAAVTPDPLAIIGQLITVMAADVSAIRKKVGA